MACVEAAVNEHQSRLIAYLYSKFRDLELAKDEAQKAFLALVRADCPAITNKLAWLIVVCTNNALRTVERQQRYETMDDATLRTVPDVTATSPAETAVDKEFFDESVRLVNELPPKQREVIRLIYFADMKPAEVAALLKTDPNNVHALHFAGIHRLRDLHQINEFGWADPKYDGLAVESTDRATKWFRNFSAAFRKDPDLQLPETQSLCNTESHIIATITDWFLRDVDPEEKMTGDEFALELRFKIEIRRAHWLRAWIASSLSRSNLLMSVAQRDALQRAIAKGGSSPQCETS